MEENNDKKKKTKKPKGPIRTGLLTFLVVFVAGIFIYTKFFLDTHLRWGIQTALTYANHAEVNVRSVTTSFTKPSFAIKGIQVTDFNNPEFNSIQVGEASYQLLWDALLRFKIVIDKANLTGLGFNQKRKSPGKIYPEVKEDAEESLLAKETKKEVEEITNDNVLGDVAKLLDGGPLKQNIKDIKFDFKSEQRIKELEKLVDEKKATWKNDVKEIKELDKLNDVIKRAKAIKFDKNPIKAAKQLKELSALKKEADGYIKNYKSKISGLKSDYTSLKNSIGEVDDLIKEDTKMVQEHFKIPEINFSEISERVFQKYVMSMIGPYMKYWHMVKEYIPARKKNYKEEFKEEKRVRAAGVNIAFPITKGYPFFWLKRMDISSDSKNEDNAYNLEGFITNASSNEKIVGKPMVMKISGDAPAKKISGISFDATVSNKSGEYKADVLGKVASFPVEKVSLSKSSKFGLALTDSTANTTVEGSLGIKEANLEMRTVFNSIKWDINAESEKTGKIFNEIFTKMPEVDLKGRIRGNYLKPRIKISSNFDQQLKAGVKSYISGKLDEAKAKARKAVEDRIAESKSKLLNNFGATEQGYLKPLLDGDKKLSDAGGIFDQIKKEQENKAKNKVENKAKKELKKLKEKLKLPF